MGSGEVFSDFLLFPFAALPEDLVSPLWALSSQGMLYLGVIAIRKLRIKDQSQELS